MVIYRWIYPLKMVIFHSYVSLPEGKSLLFYQPPSTTVCAEKLREIQGLQGRAIVQGLHQGGEGRIVDGGAPQQRLLQVTLPHPPGESCRYIYIYYTYIYIYVDVSTGCIIYIYIIYLSTVYIYIYLSLL